VARIFTGDERLQVAEDGSAPWPQTRTTRNAEPETPLRASVGSTKLFRISRLRCVDTESKAVPCVSARNATTHGRMASKTGIATRWRSHFLRCALKNRNRPNEATLASHRASLGGRAHSSLTGSNTLMRIAALSLLALATCSSPVCAAEAKPNIVFILADDLGYGDLGCYGQTKIRTPNLDRMAAEGMRFTNFYAGSTVCAPSRCTLMTGKHLGHATVRDNMQRKPGAEGQHPMEPGTITVAELLKREGYATAVVGKWGLGMPEDHSSPLDYGFDHHYGYLCQGMAHTYYPP
jgi:Sulfatase